MSYHFNYQADKEQVLRVIEKAPREKGVISVEKTADTQVRIEYDREQTNMGKLIAAFRNYRPKVEEQADALD